MDRQLINYCIVILFVTLIETKDINTNEGQRKSGRTVKLYSGVRPEPINCTNEGFQPDTHDCAVFYRCMKSGNGKYSFFKFQCGPGTVYDPETEVCNHPRNTKRSECGGLIKPSLDQSNINEIDEEVQELPSPITTIRPVYTESPSTFKPTSSIPTSANWISQSIYGKPLPTTTKEQSTTTGTVTTSINSFVTLNETQYSPIGSDRETTTKLIWTRPTLIPNTRKPSPQNDMCTSDGFMGDSENCHKFYRCVRNERGAFTRYEFSCSESTIWDEDLQSCNHPWAVKRSRCGRSNSNIPDKLNSNSNTSNKHEPFKENVLSQENAIKDGDVTVQDYLLNSSKFTQSPTLINNQIPTQISQNKTSTQSLIDNSIQDSQSLIQINKPNLGGTNNREDFIFKEQMFSTEKNISDSNNVCNESGFMRDQYDCKKFYRCVDNGRGSYTRYQYYCGKGTVWDSKIEGCNHAWAVKDCNSTSVTEPTSQDTDTLSSTTLMNTVTSTHVTSTNKPLVGVNEPTEDAGYGIIPMQPTSTISPLTTVNIVQTTKQNEESLVQSECMSDGFIGDKNDCKVFYRCIENNYGEYTKIKFNCGDGTVWDPTIEACNHQWAVKKCGGATVSEFNKTGSTTKITTHLTSTLYPSSVIISATNPDDTDNVVDYDSGYGITSKKPVYLSTTKATTEPVEQNSSINNNFCKHSGFMSDKNDCKKFYRCIDDGNGSYIRYEFTCGEGTLWDPKIEACNHAWAVNSCRNEEATTKYPITSSITSTIFHGESISSSVHTSSSNKDPDLATSPSATTPIIQSTTVNVVFNQCKTSGFIGDFNNCRKFYRCVDNADGSFTQYEFQCGEGTVWDQKIQACNHAWAVEKCGGYTQTENSTLTPSSKPIMNDEQIITGGYPINDEPQLSETHTTHTPLVTHSTTSDSDINNMCVKSGFMGDKRVCKKFYRCVEDGKGSYIQYEFVCGEGTVWDQEIEACNHVWAVKKCASEDAAVLDIVGSSTQNVILTTAAEEPINHYTSERITTLKTSTESTTNISDKATSQIPQISQTICQTEGFYGNPNDCKKFYRCVDDGKSGFIRYEFMCGEGTFWNNEIQACDHKYNNHKCSQNVVPSSTDKTTSTVLIMSSSASSPILSTFSQEEHTTQIAGISPQPGTFKCLSNGFFPDPQDCRKFIRCVDNGNGGYTKYDFKCGEGTVWVQDIQACDHDDGSESCKNQTNSTEFTVIAVDLASSTKIPQYISSSTITTVAQVSLQQNDEFHTEKELISQTNNICFEEGYHGSKDNCRKFYRCVNNGHNGFTKYEFTCGEGTAWDENIKACNHATEVKSCQNTNQDQSEAVPVYHDDDIQQVTTSQTSSTTEDTNLSESTQSSTNENSCHAEGYFGNTQDCKKFYRCVYDGKGNFTKYEYMCGDGTIWDQDITTCNHPNDVANPTCKQNQSNSSSNPSTSSSSDSTVSITESSHSNCSQEEPSSKPPNKNFTCEKAGYYPDPNDCKNFYRCVDWDGDGTRYSVYHFTCGEGTIWDPVVETCNHEDSVYPPRNCSGTLSQTDTENQGSTSTESALTQEPSTTQHSQTSHTTTEPMNTSEQTTTDSTTTYQSPTTTSTTTSKQTTTTEHSTSEQTTQQATTNPSTTKQSTTSQQTTQSSTSQQTTTQKSTTSEPTTQESTTSEKTTTQKTPTSEKTTQEPSTSEQTTTQKTSTSEQTTHEPSTSEQTTTQKISTSEETTQESSTSEQTTTQQSTSIQQTTTVQTTSEQTTQTESITESTTGLLTTEQQITSEQTTLFTTDESITTEHTTDSTTVTEQMQSTTEETSPVKQNCPETEEDQYLFVCPTSFRRHHKYCNMFYQCTEDDDSHEVKIAMFTCPNNTIYDETKIQCVDKNKAERKCNGQMAKIRRVKRLGKVTKEPIMVDKHIQACPTIGHYPFEKEAECSPAFLRCTNTKAGKVQGYIYQCPQGYVYWSISRRCEQKQNVRDCRISRNDWTNRWEIPIDSSNIAP